MNNINNIDYFRFYKYRNFYFIGDPQGKIYKHLWDVKNRRVGVLFNPIQININNIPSEIVLMNISDISSEDLEALQEIIRDNNYSIPDKYLGNGLYTDEL